MEHVLLKLLARWNDPSLWGRVVCGACHSINTVHYDDPIDIPCRWCGRRMF